MVRIATVRDAEQLSILNDEFNGKDETTIDNIRNSIINNKQEVVIVAQSVYGKLGYIDDDKLHLSKRIHNNKI